MPDLTRAGEVTIRMLLSHTSRYSDYWPEDYSAMFKEVKLKDGSGTGYGPGVVIRNAVVAPLTAWESRSSLLTVCMARAAG